MASGVRFQRTHNRTAKDVFANLIRPAIPEALDMVMQKMTYFNVHNHSYHNRSGALENSVTWQPAEQKGEVVEGALIAGGPSKAKFTFTQSPVFYKDEQGRLRVFEPKEPRVIRKGQAVNVNYAAFVEIGGRPVLKQGIEKYRGDVVKMVARVLRNVKQPRMYTFKYTGQTADIYGGRV